MGEGASSWAFLVRWISSVLSERKVTKVSSVIRCLCNHVEVNVFLSYKCLV